MKTVNNFIAVKTIPLITFLIVLNFCCFSQKTNPEATSQKPVASSLKPAADHLTLSNDIALIRPLININDSNGGYYSEYFGPQFQYMYCGAVVSNLGTFPATHVFIELSIRDWTNTVIFTYYSDSVAQINPGETATFNIPGQLTFVPWIYEINNLLFAARSDSIDENTVNNEEAVNFPVLYENMWSHVSRSFMSTNSIDLSQYAGFQSGDFAGFRLSVPTWGHMCYNIGLYLTDSWPVTLQMNAVIYINGHVMCSAPFNHFNISEPSWIYSQAFYPYDGFYPDSTYYIGVEFSWSPGTSAKIGTDTSNYHNIPAESVAKLGNSWTQLNFVPVMQLICDPEGIDEHGSPARVSIYPNPAGERFTVENVNGAKLELYDMTGKLVLTDTGSDSSRKIDISYLPGGIYLLKINGKGWLESMKIVIE